MQANNTSFVVESKRILIADDDPIIIELLEHALGAAGYEVYAANSGEEAIECATTDPIDLALLDYRMPGISGLEAGKTIYGLTGARFIVMSVHSDHDLIDQASEHGALGFLVKPLEIKEVLAQIRVGLGRAAEIEQLQSSLTHMEKYQESTIAKAISSARSVNTAIGILMERLRKPRDEVHRLLVRRARSERKRLVDVSEKIITARETDYQWSTDHPRRGRRSPVKSTSES